MNDAEEEKRLLKKLWETELEILDVFHQFCAEHGLRYSIAYGTLLGAVRHKGFIPWDDDIDVIMPREDYDKLINYWKMYPPNGYVLQDETIGNCYPNNFAKIRKDHTTFLQFENERTNNWHKGIFIDIFPGDRQAPGLISRMNQRLLFLLCLLYNREYPSTAGLRGHLENFLIQLVPKKDHRRFSIWLSQQAKRWNHLQQEKYIFPVTARSCKKQYSKSLFDHLQKVEFEGRFYNATAESDEFLRIAYGDYMKLPSQKERVWTHHPIILDFSHNYEELSEEERFPAINKK